MASTWPRTLRYIVAGAGCSCLLFGLGMGLVWMTSPWWGVFADRVEVSAAWILPSAQATWWGGLLLALLTVTALMWLRMWGGRGDRRSRRRRDAVAVTAVAVVVATIMVAIPGVLARQAAVGPGEKGEGVLRVLSANTLFNRADDADLAATARDIDADVVVLSETSVEEVSVVVAATGLHNVLSVSGQVGANATALLVPEELMVPDFGVDARITRHQNPMVVLSLPDTGAVAETGGSSKVTVMGLHTNAPAYPELAHGWVREMGNLKHWAAEVTGPVIIAGDFNATAAHPEFRRLLGERGGVAGLQDCTGGPRMFGGFLDAPTWPSSGRIPTPLLRLDHVLVRGVPCAAGGVIEVSGSDHLAVWADLRF